MAEWSQGNISCSDPEPPDLNSSGGIQKVLSAINFDGSHDSEWQYDTIGETASAGQHAKILPKNALALAQEWGSDPYDRFRNTPEHPVAGASWETDFFYRCIFM